MTRPARRLVATLALALLAPSAGAQSCAGFTDVLAGDMFCDNIQWIKNRGVTRGCTATTYCPDQNVRRDQMAAFMNRLGLALTPEILAIQSDTGPITLPSAVADRRCATGDSLAQVPPALFARQVTVMGVFSGLADTADAAWSLVPLVSTDGGATWATFNGTDSIGTRSTAKAGLWASSTVTESMNLDPGAVVRFSLGILRDAATTTTGNLAHARCSITAVIGNRNPTSPPF